MDRSPLDSLTRSERIILQLLLQERDQKAIARQLQLSPETVKTHLRNAREKTGIRSSFALAKALEAHDPSPPSWGIPLPGGATSAAPSVTTASSKRSEDPEQVGDAVNEERAVFHYDRPSTWFGDPSEEKRGNETASATRLLIIAGLVLALMMIILLAFPLSESFQRFANVLDPPKP